MTSHSEVVFTLEDVILGAKHAELRNFESLHAGYTDRFMATEVSPMQKLKKEVCGVLGEIAVMKFLGLKSALRINGFKQDADIGDDIEVRTIHRPDGCLVIRPNEDTLRRYVLVHVYDFKAKLLGWIPGYEGALEEYKSDPGNRGKPCWSIPQGRLYPMQDFDRRRHEQAA